MIFCNYQSNTNSTVTYRFGGTTNDITGLFVYDFVNKNLHVIEEPKKDYYPVRHLLRLIRSKQPQFEQKIFEENLSYESG